MARTRSIPDSPELHAEIMVKVAEGRTNAEIATWLAKKLGKYVNRHMVSTVVAERRAEREVATRAVLEEQAGKTAVADLSYIGRMLTDAHEIQCANMPPLGGETELKTKKGEKKRRKPMHSIALKAIEVQRRLIEMRFALLGIGKLPPGTQGGVIILPPPEND